MISGCIQLTTSRFLFSLTKINIPQISIRTYKHKPKRYPRMSPADQQSILDRLAALQITHSGVVEHAAVANGAEWRSALESSDKVKELAGGKEWELTKTVS